MLTSLILTNPVTYLSANAFYWHLELSERFPHRGLDQVTLYLASSTEVKNLQFGATYTWNCFPNHASERTGMEWNQPRRPSTSVVAAEPGE